MGPACGRRCAVLPEPPPWSGDAWGLLTGVIGVAYVSGFVILVAPSGLGVRELMLTLFLVPLFQIGHAEAEASVVALRLAWTASEVVMIALVWKLPALRSLPPSPLGGEGLGVRGRNLPDQNPSPPTPLPGVPGRGESRKGCGAMISVVIPVYNERDSLPQLHAEIVTVAAPRASTSKSSSWTTAAATAPGRPSPSWPASRRGSHGIRFRRNFGKAAALSAGFRAARGDIIMTLDADLQDDPKEIPRFLEALAGGLDVVSGWKQVRHDPWHKTLPSKVFNGLVGWLTGVRLHDHNCGIKCYRAEVLHEVRLYGELHRFVPVLAAARGFKIGEIAIDHRPRRFGHSKYGVRRFVKGFLDLLDGEIPDRLRPAAAAPARHHRPGWLRPGHSWDWAT